MSAPFLDFFSKLQERQAEVAGQSGQQFQRNGASAAAIAAAAAAPTSRVESHRHDGDMPPNEPGRFPYLRKYAALFFKIQSLFHYLTEFLLPFQQVELQVRIHQLLEIREQRPFQLGKTTLLFLGLKFKPLPDVSAINSKPCVQNKTSSHSTNVNHTLPSM